MTAARETVVPPSTRFHFLNIATVTMKGFCGEGEGKGKLPIGIITVPVLLASTRDEDEVVVILRTVSVEI